MSARLIIRTFLLLAVTSHAAAQYVDFFQNLNTFLQPFTTTKARNDVTKRPDTKHRQTNKQKYQDAIFFPSDDIIKDKENRYIDPFNLEPTTTKPKRISTKTNPNYNAFTTKAPEFKLKEINNNKINNNRNNHEIRSISNQETYNNVDNNNNGRRIDNYNGYNDNGNYNTGYNNNENYNYQGVYSDRQTTQRPVNNKQTTRRTTTTERARSTTRANDYYYYKEQTTQRQSYYNERTTQRSPNNRGIYNSRTTSNPLLHRPGVKPAAVDENLPPITNRPITTNVYDRPFDLGTYKPANRPDNTIPPYEENTRRPETRPVNTRPPFETARPVFSSVSNKPVSNVGLRDEAEPVIEIGADEDEMTETEKRRLYDICEQKCEEYKSLRVKKVVALPLHTAVEVNVSSCARTNVPLILGGTVVDIKEFPHMALVGWKKVQSAGYSWKCGGSLISEQYVLTAGHCTYHDKDYNVRRYDGPPQAVQLGSSYYSDRSATVVTVSAVIRHPKYKLRRSYYDVALIKMATTVRFSETISPACLGVPPAVGEPVIATGWGKTEFGGDSSTELRSVSVPIWEMSECREIWGTSLKLPHGPMSNSQVCAGERTGAKDTCQGDSGGPAQVQEGCAWRVVAVTSVGRSCGAPDTPALYATIPRAFIASQVYTNVKTARDNNNDYGNEGTNNRRSDNNNNNRRSGNNQSSSSILNNNSESGNYNSGNQYGNRGVANIRPVHNNNDNHNGGVQNDGQYYDSLGSSSSSPAVNNNWSNNNGYGNTDNNNNGYNSNNNNGYNNQNSNVYEQSSYNGQNDRTTTVKYNQNNYNNGNYAQNGYSNQQNYNTNADASGVNNYQTQNYGYNDNGRTNNGYNDNGSVNNGHNDNTRTGYNGYNSNTAVPWYK